MKQNKKAKIVFIVLLVLGIAAVGLAVWEICTNGFSVKTGFFKSKADKYATI